MSDQLWDDIADHLRPYAQFRAGVLASPPAWGRPYEDQIVGWYYDHLDYLGMALDAMVLAITEAAFIAHTLATWDDDWHPEYGDLNDYIDRRIAAIRGMGVTND